MNRNIDIAPEEFEIIEQYILQQLPAADADVFTARLQNDEVLRNKLHAVRLLLLGVQEASLTNTIADFHNDLKKSTKESQPTGKMISLKYWLAAASVLLIVALGVIFFNGPDTTEKIFATYYKPDPGMISTMGTSDNYMFDRAMIDYKTKNYDKAIEAWENLLVTNPANDTLNYFVASAYLAKKQNDKALEYFQKVIAVSNSYFLKDAYWYAGLTMVNEGRTKEAIPFIEKSEHPQKEALLLKLKR